MNKNCGLSDKMLLVFPLLLFLTVLSFFTMAAAMASNRELTPQVLINGQKVTFPDAQPFLDDNGRVQAPVRRLAEELGASVNWDGSACVAVIYGHGKSVSLAPGRDTAEVNGSQVFTGSRAIIDQGRLYVPLRFLAETLGADVLWDDAGRTVRIVMELPLIRDYGISYTKQDAGWYTVPSTFTAWVRADNVQKVDFYLTPTGTNQEPVKIATAYSNSGEFSITYTLPGGYTLAHFWAVAVNDKGEESTGILNVYCEPGSNPAN